VLPAVDVLCLEAFGALYAFELDGLALVQGTITIFLDHGIVNEDILASAALDETIAFGAVKPLNCSLLSHNELLSPLCSALEPLSRAEPYVADQSVEAVAGY
jgi:hypothetical protein